VKVNDWEVLKDEDSIAGCLEPKQDGVGIVAAHFSKSARSGAPPVRITQLSKIIEWRSDF
jgi:hypothetical protein